jgi:signal peptidase II
MREAAARGWARWLLLSAAVIAIDLATKAWVSAAFALGESREVLPMFNLVLAHNPGAAFSFLAGAGGWQRWVFTAITVVISIALVVGLRRPHRNALVPASFALVLGGALGNLYDRLTLGYVVDFLDFHWGAAHFPAFNVADSAISVGVALLLLDGLRPSQRGVAGEPARQEKP